MRDAAAFLEHMSSYQVGAANPDVLTLYPNATGDHDSIKVGSQMQLATLT